MTQQDNQPNYFEFTGDAQITYLPNNANDQPQLDYQDAEYKHTFTGNDINVQQSVLGTMLTVTLKILVDVGDIKLTLLLPEVRMADPLTEQAFNTVAIKTQSTVNLVKPGPTLSYQVLNLQGKADIFDF